MREKLSETAPLSCNCKTVRGAVAQPSPNSANRVVCYCDDCQAFAHALSREDLLNPQGGTDIVQVAPARVSFSQGTDKIKAMRLSDKGLIRWYATCCNTPLGNTVGPALPFVGIVTDAFDGRDLDAMFGTSVPGVNGKDAIGHAPNCADGLGFRFAARIALLLLTWRLKGLGWPNPFFEREDGSPRYPVETLSPEDREALRPLCGPAPA